MGCRVDSAVPSRARRARPRRSRHAGARLLAAAGVAATIALAAACAPSTTGDADSSGRGTTGLVLSRTTVDHLVVLDVSAVGGGTGRRLTLHVFDRRDGHPIVDAAPVVTLEGTSGTGAALIADADADEGTAYGGTVFTTSDGALAPGDPFVVRVAIGDERTEFQRDGTVTADPFDPNETAEPTGEARRVPWRRRSVGRTVGTALGVVIGLVVATILVISAALTDLAGEMGTVSTRDLAAAQATAQVRSDIVRMLRSQTAYVLDDGRSRTRFEADAEQVDAALARLGPLAADADDHALRSRLRSALGTFRAIDAEIWQAVQEGRRDDAAGLVAGPSALAVRLLEADAEALVSRTVGREERHLVHVTSSLGAVRLAFLGLGLVTTVVGVALAVRTARHLREPLTELERAARLAASGDLAVHVEPSADDEVGRLVEAFNTMVAALRRSVTDGTFDTQLRAALEMVDNEPAVIEVLGEAVNEVVPAYPTEFLLADPVKAQMEQSTVRGPIPAGPGCAVDSPFGCAAVRSGQVATFPSSGELGACPHLRNRPYGMVSATCVPVMFMGRALGVIHTVGPAGTPLPEADVERLRVLASQAGSRIGMVRAFDRTQLQASTDALTGLPNRRALEARADQLAAKGTPYAVLLFDLDRFKALNDTHGHEAGDRALRRFAGVLRESVRPKDLAVRYGGEEFVVVLPAGGAALALAVAERVRRRLGELAAGSDAPPFTVSAGIATTARQGGFEAVLRAADGALYEAKADGRDRCVLAIGEDAADGGIDLQEFERGPGEDDPNPWPVKRPDAVFDGR